MLLMIRCMRSRIGVTHGLAYPRLPKRELLFFDKIGVIQLPWLLTFHRESGYGKHYIADEYEWLQDQGLVFDLSLNNPDEIPTGSEIWRESWREATDAGRRAHELQQAWNAPDGMFIPRSIEEMHALEQQVREYTQLARTQHAFEARAFAAGLRATRNVDAVSLLPVQDAEHVVARDEILRIVINELPIPDDGTPWEDVMAFKQDPVSVRKLLALREWIRDIATLGRDAAGVEDRLAFLLSEYASHLAHHQLKYSRGALEVVVTTGAEIAEDVIKFKWKELTGMLFAIRHQQIDLLESERTAPGREVSYILHAKAAFR